MNKVIMVVIALILFSGCSPKESPELIQARTQISKDNTQIAMMQENLNEYQSATPKIITATFIPTPMYTPTITNTPSPTRTPSPTKDPRMLSKGDGFYLIGNEIMPGVWRSGGSGDRCYWSVTRANGDIIDNHFGMAGGTAWLPEYGFQVQFENCGTWEYLGSN